LKGEVRTAFVLGAGLGTRLRPLTEALPKPLVPVFNKPLITFAFDHLLSAGVGNFVVNTHHCPEAYAGILGEKNGRAEYRGAPVVFRHEPVLLETGGGIRNVADLLGDAPFLVYNGDVLADFPLEPLLERHAGSGNIATLALRSNGAERRIQFDADSGLVTDMRGLIGGRTEPSFLFTGASVFSPEIHRWIEPGRVVSIIPVLVDLMRRGARVGACVVDEGVWFDIGNPEAYLDVHRALGGHRFSYLRSDWLRPIGEGVKLGADVRIAGCSAIGAGAEIGRSAELEDVVVWPGERVPAGLRLRDAVVLHNRVWQSDCPAAQSAS
jgi:mannose-1-phosphate guanylyltransferase